MLRQGVRRQKDTKSILKKIKALCAGRGVAPIVISSAQHLYHSFDRKECPSKLFVVKRIMDEYFYEPIEKYSNLLQKYNEEINIADVYILKEDYARVVRGLKKLLAGYQRKALGL
jgi:hypothetical protein